MKGTDLMIAKLQEYYGMAYPEGMGKVIVQYLDGLDDSFKPYLMAETFKAQSASFKALPDVAVFESVMKSARASWEEALGKYMALGVPRPAPEELVTDQQLDEFATDIKSLVEAKLHGQMDELVERWKNRVKTARREPYKDE